MFKQIKFTMVTMVTQHAWV